MNNTYNMNRVIKFFNFKTFYTLFELEYKKEQLISENKEDINTINERYEESLGIKKDFTIPKTKLTYKELTTMDLYTLKNGLVSYIYNNKELEDLYKYIETVEQEIKNEKDEEKIKLINLDFSKKYYEVVRKTVDTYKRSIMNNDLDEKQINWLNFYTKDSDILSKKLSSILDKISSIAKPITKSKQELDVIEVGEKIKPIERNNSNQEKFDKMIVATTLTNNSDEDLSSIIKNYSKDEIKLIDFSNKPGKYYDRTLAIINMCIDKTKKYLFREEFKSVLEKYYPDIDKFYINIVYDFSKKISKEQLNDNKDVSEVTKKYLLLFKDIYNELCNEINKSENINLVTNYDDIPTQSVEVLQK